MSEQQTEKDSSPTITLLDESKRNRFTVITEDERQLSIETTAFRNALSRLRKATLELSDVIHHLGSASHLGKAAKDVARRLHRLHSIPVQSYTSNLGAVVLDDQGDYPSSRSDFDSDSSDDWDERSNDTFESASPITDMDIGDGSHGTDQLPTALMFLAHVLPVLHDALSDIESYRLFSDDYKSLLVFHDKLLIMQCVIRRFGHQDNLYPYLLSSLESLTRSCNLSSDALERFVKIGSEGIKTAQSRVASLHMNAATVATFLAGVTATTLQFTFEKNDTALEIVVNSLWIGSLALSIGSATNSFLALAWRQSFFSSPGRKVSWWAAFWIRRGYLALLIASCASFLAGLLCFTIRTQHIATFWVLIGTTIIFNVSVACALVWFGRDRWLFLQWIHKQRIQDIRWLTKIRDRRRNWRARAPSLVASANSRTGTRVNLAVSGAFWWIQDLLFDLSLPFLPIQFIGKRALGHFKRQRKSTDEEVPGQQHTASFLSTALAAKAVAHNDRRRKGGGQISGPLVLKCYPSYDIQFSPDGKWLVSLSRKSVLVFSVQSEQFIKKEQVIKLNSRLQDGKIVWMEDKSSVGFCVIGAWKCFRNFRYVVVEEYAIHSIGPDPTQQFRYSSVGIVRLTNLTDLQSDFTWSIHDQRISVFNRESDGCVNQIQRQPTPTMDKHRQLGCPSCGDLMVLIACLDIGNVQLRTTTTSKVAYALAFCRGRGGQRHASYVPLAGKIRDVSFNVDKGPIFNEAGPSTKNHAHEILISFASRPPQMWTFEHSDRGDELTFRRSFTTKPENLARISGSKWGTARFVGMGGDKVLTCVDNEVQLFNKDTGDLVWNSSARFDGQVSLSAWCSLAGDKSIYAVASGSRISYWWSQGPRSREASGVAGTENTERLQPALRPFVNRVGQIMKRDFVAVGKRVPGQGDSRH